MLGFRFWLDLVANMVYICLQDEKIELCRFSKDGTKPFLFCAVQKGVLISINVACHFI
jgi:hypothetical protein